MTKADPFLKLCVALQGVVLTAVLLAAGCTEQQRARSVGGAASVDLPCGERLAMLTWKASDLWYLTRPLAKGERPETYAFRESSSFGVFEGSITIRESRCGQVSSRRNVAPVKKLGAWQKVDGKWVHQ